MVATLTAGVTFAAAFGPGGFLGAPAGASVASTQVQLPAGTAEIFKDSFTIEAWVHPTRQGADETILGTPFNLNNKTMIVMLRHGRPFFSFHGGATYLLAPSAVPLNRWSHLAFVFEREGGSGKPGAGQLHNDDL